MDKLTAMASAAPIFYLDVVSYVDRVLVLVLLVIEFVALINCAVQRADAFPVVGSIAKSGWLLILGGAILVTFACGLYFFGLFAVTAALVYLLDVRPAIRDVINGRGSW